MKYSFGKDEIGRLQITVPYSTQKEYGISPTELHRFILEFQKELFINRNSSEKRKLKIDIGLKRSRKFDNSVIEFIKKEEKIYNKRGKQHQHNYEYYAFTLYALRRLGYVCDDGELVNQTRLSEAIGLRRPTLCVHYGNLENVVQNDTYLEIEKKLYYLD